MIHPKPLRVICILAVLLASCAAITGGAAQAAQPMPTTHASLQCGKWSVVASPPIILGVSQLNGVSAVSDSDIWAVGSSNTASQTLIEQWNGASWQIVSSPNVNTYNALNGVAAVSATDIWAVGYSGDINDVNSTLIEHWDGSQWSVISSPNVAGTQNDILTGIAAISASDIWAVGYYGTAAYTTQHTLTEHWNGSQWSIVKSPNVDKGIIGTQLFGVSAVASNDVWAVGYVDIDDYHAIIEHWDGSHWRISLYPNISSKLYAVVGVSVSDVWAVGSSVGAQTFTDHWNGSSWQIVQSPTPHGINTLTGVAADGASNLWSVGWDEVALTIKPVTEHWNGTAWKLVQSPTLTHGGQFLAVTFTASSQVWAVGSYAINKNHTVFDPLIEHYC